jgi:hypothetical protein
MISKSWIGGFSPMEQQKSSESKSENPERGVDPSRSEEARQIVRQYIADQRAVLRKLQLLLN